MCIVFEKWKSVLDFLPFSCMAKATTWAQSPKIRLPVCPRVICVWSSVWRLPPPLPMPKQNSQGVEAASATGDTGCLVRGFYSRFRSASVTLSDGIPHERCALGCLICLRYHWGGGGSWCLIFAWDGTLWLDLFGFSSAIYYGVM